ncbi:MAG: aldehyde ferredoxin oxidoreductase family protein [Halobacteriota archaeon]|nr:aldehyde ferredoxin oxidoreductase family protein [Halobacteriota archaeon]
MLGGYMGRFLDINLSAGEVGNYEIDDETRRLYVGGKGLGARLLYDNTEKGVDPLSPDNVLIITTGPVTGTNAPSSSRFNVTTKSPSTGGIASSSSGGDFGNHLKKAGYDGIIVRGKADNPVYIDIENENVEIKDASDFWGLDTEEVLEKLVGESKKGLVTIGPAGENLVLLSSIVSPRIPPRRSGIAGRCGVGAVMGSKNLKAILASGDKKIQIADEEEFKKLAKKQFKSLGEGLGVMSLSQYGTASMVNPMNASNVLPTKNYKFGTFKDAESISGEELTEKYLVKNMGCSGCSIKCGRVVKLNGKEVKGPEYETLTLFGSNIGNNDMEKIIEWNDICDRMGMDTMSCGGTIGFAMELKENGLLDTELEFGRTDNISDMLIDIAHRRGLGDELANGVKWLSEKYGGKEYAIHSKGLELAAYNPSGCVGQGLSYATTNRGGCHLGGYVVALEALGPLVVDPLSTKSKPELTIMFQNLMDSINCLDICFFSLYVLFPNVAYNMNPTGLISKMMSSVMLRVGPLISLIMNIRLPMQATPYEKYLSMATGEKYTFSDFLKVGERTFNMERRFNIREGITSKDDALAERVKGPLDEMLPRYYKLRGWTDEGIPKKDTLDELNIKV